MKKVVINVIILILLIIIIFSGYKIFEGWQLSEKIKNFDNDIIKNYEVTNKNNNNLKKLKKKNLDICGWIKINNTNINYPIVKGKDNSFYLNHNIFNEYAAQGSIFMDYRCENDFSLFNTIIYGHQINNGRMFDNIRNFNDKDYFDSHKKGKVFADNKEYNLEIFAYMTVNSNADVYKTVFISNLDKQKHLDYLKSTAKFTNDIKIKPDDHIITLSTCTYEFKNARSVLIAKMVQE